MASTLVLLAGRGESTNIIYNSLKEYFSIEKVVQEEPVPTVQFLKRRAKRLGVWKVFGQVLFQLLVVPYLQRTSQARLREIKEKAGLNDAPIERSKLVKVKSINSDETMSILRKIKPRIVVVSGTRIIANRILSCIPAVFVNLHAGITPQYRGVHGAYWALVEGRKSACGVTVHYVDSGIDTGDILEQRIIEPTPEDNFVTYPLLQLGVGVPLLKEAIENILGNRAEVRAAPQGKSKLWTHPTLWEYLWYRARYGVK